MMSNDDDLLEDYSAEMQPKRPSNTEFMKHDTGKCRVSLVDPDFTLGVGAILTFGAQKYAANNWKLMAELERCKDAAYRHFLAYMSGELLDPESNLPHLDHLATNIMFLRYFEHGKGAQPNKES
jgi:hypothetical protein